MFTGYAPAPVVEAVSRRVAAGSQFLLPTEDSIWVAEELGRRYGLPKWQFTLAATSANTEVIRIARAVTGPRKVLFFDGKYHGHFDDALVEIVDGALAARGGRPPARRHRADLARAVQRPRGPWSGCSRPATSRWSSPNRRSRTTSGLLMPDDGFHAGLREVTRRTGTLLGLRRDPHAGRGARRADPDVGSAPRLRHGRQVDRCRHPAGRLRDDRRGGGGAAAARWARRRQAAGRGRRHTVRQPGLHGRRAGGDG